MSVTAHKYQKLLRHEKQTLINPLFTGEKLRQYVSTYKRHTIQRPIRPDEFRASGRVKSTAERIRTSPSDYFQVYCREIIP
jgi:hypothetical protein